MIKEGKHIRLVTQHKEEEEEKIAIHISRPSLSFYFILLVVVPLKKIIFFFFFLKKYILISVFIFLNIYSKEI